MNIYTSLWLTKVTHTCTHTPSLQCIQASLTEKSSHNAPLCQWWQESFGVRRFLGNYVFRDFIKYVRLTRAKPAPLFSAPLPVLLTPIRSPQLPENKNRQWLPFSNVLTHTSHTHTRTHFFYSAIAQDAMTKLIKSINRFNIQALRCWITAQHVVFPEVTSHPH